MSLNIKIENVKKGTDNQVAKGIHAKFNMDLYGDDNVQFITLKNLTLRKTRQGTWYIQPPYETWQDRENNQKKSYFFYLYPDSDDRDAKLSGIVSKVVAMLDTVEDAPSTNAPPAASTPVATTEGDGTLIF